MPPVVAAGAWLVATIGWGGIVAIGIATAAAGMAYQAAKAARNAGNFSPAAQKQMFRAAAAPKQIILGHPITSGPMVFAAEHGTPNDKGEGEWLHLIVHLAGHECTDVTDGWMNDEKLNRAAIPAKGADITFTHPNGLGSAHIYLGGMRTTPPDTIKGLPDWKPTMVGKGQCFAHIALKSDPAKWPGGIPNPKFAVKGMKVFDPRTNTTQWTDNPALLARWYRNELKHGKAIEEAYVTAANICDESVLLPNGKREKRYRCNYAFPCAENPRAALGKISATCAGNTLRVAGKHAMQVGAYYGPGVITLSQSDVIGELTTTPDIRRRDRINTVSAKYIDPESYWNEVDMPRVVHEGYKKDDGLEIMDDLNLECCPSPFQAQRVAWIHLNTTRQGISVEFPCNFRGLELLPGTVFKLDFPENKWNGVEFKVERWKLAHANGITLVCKQHLAANYEWNKDTAKVPDRPGVPSVLDPTKVEPVTKLTYRTLYDSNTLQALITWEHQSFGNIKYEVTFLKGGVLQRVETVTDKQFRMQDGFEVGTYEVRVVAIQDTFKSRSPIVSLVFTTSPPMTPIRVDTVSSNWSITLKPVSQVTNFDTVYDFAAGFDSSIPDSELPNHIVGRAKVLIVENLRPNTEYNYAVREISRWGGSGWLRGKAKTAFNSDDILVVIDGKIGHDVLDKKLRDSLDNMNKRSVDLNNLINDKSRLSAPMVAAYQEFLAKGKQGKTEVGFAYAEDEIRIHKGELSTQAEHIRQLFVADEKNLALARQYTRAAVGYCIDKDGNITDHNDAVMCVKAGNSWVDGPLAEFMRNLQVKTGKGETASVINMGQAFERADGKLVARGGMTTDVNGKISGFVNTNEGDITALDFIAQHTRFGDINDQGHFNPLLYLDTQSKLMVLHGQLQLKDGFNVTKKDDIKGLDGKDGTNGTDGTNGNTIFTEFQFSINGTDWHYPEQENDLFLRTRVVTNTQPGPWGATSKIRGKDGNNGQDGQNGNDGSTIYTELQFSADGNSWHYPEKPGDKFLRSRTVTNGAPSPWGSTTTIKGDDGTNGQDGNTIYTQLQFSADKVNWHYPERDGDMYLRSRVVTNGVPDAWGNTTKIRGKDGTNGKDGANGSAGAGFYTLVLRNGVFPPDATATNDFKAAYNRAPALDDHLTYRNAAGSASSTKRYTGTAWSTPNLLLHGDLISKGTVSGDRFTAGTEITSPSIYGGLVHGANVVTGHKGFLIISEYNQEKYGTMDIREIIRQGNKPYYGEYMFPYEIVAHSSIWDPETVYWKHEQFLNLKPGDHTTINIDNIDFPIAPYNDPDPDKTLRFVVSGKKNISNRNFSTLFIINAYAPDAIEIKDNATDKMVSNVKLYLNVWTDDKKEQCCGMTIQFPWKDGMFTRRVSSIPGYEINFDIDLKAKRFRVAIRNTLSKYIKNLSYGLIAENAYNGVAQSYVQVDVGTAVITNGQNIRNIT